jgi:hypothetical protein
MFLLCELYERGKQNVSTERRNYSSAPVYTGNAFNDLHQLYETADNTVSYV